MTDRAVVGARIRAERETRIGSRTALAVRLRSASREPMPEVESLTHMIKEWERGKHSPGERYQPLLARVLGLDEATLFGMDVALDPWAIGNGGVDRERLTAALVRPAWVDGAVVDALATVLAGQRRLEDAVGAGVLLDPVTSQLHGAVALLRETRGPHRDGLARVTADWSTFTGWLHAATRQDARALALFGQAEELADDVGYGAGAGLATSFKGYVARQQGRPHGVVRAAAGAMATPGVHASQRAFDSLQAAQGYAGLGDVERVRPLLDDAADLAAGAGEPPPATYWYTEPFFKLNIGLVLLGIGEHRDAAATLREGLAGMPPDQRGAAWIEEYETALERASERT